MWVDLGGLGWISTVANFLRARAHANSARVNKIQAKYGKSCLNVKVKPRGTFTFKCGVSYTVSILFTDVKI